MAAEPRTSQAGWRAILARLMGLSTMPTQVIHGATVVHQDDAFGGQLTPPPVSQTRWLLSDIETATYEADQGNLATAARLCRSMRADGKLSGVMSTRTDGLVRLPIKWSGDEEMRREFEGRDRKRGLFATMFPSAELALMAGDGIQLGVGVGEMLRIPTELLTAAGIDPNGPPSYVMRRLEPEYLLYRWNENRWYYNSIRGLLPIIPGERRYDGGWWILHRPGGEVSPWTNGLWRSTGRSFIAKEHAILHRENYSAKLAQAARAATSPVGASEAQRQGMLQKLISWGVNQAFQLPQGWDVKLIESNGRGYEVFQATIDTSDNDYVVAVAGQTVTTDGGSGFANAEIHKTIRADLIQSTADGLALTINEQGILPFVNAWKGAGALATAPWMEWDTSPPKEMKAQADSLMTVGNAIRSVNQALRPYGRRVDVYEICTRYNVPLAKVEQPDVQPRESVEPGGHEDAGAIPADDQGVDPLEVIAPGPGTGNGEKTGETTAARTRTLALASSSPGPKVRDYSGIKVIIDRPKGYHQRGEGSDGRKWDRVYTVDYGYLEDTRGGDGEELDAFCGPTRHAPMAWVALQVDEDGDFDEFKLMLGFDSEIDARACYASHIPTRLLASMFEIPTELLRGMVGLEPRARKGALVRAFRTASEAA